ncbi:MAG: hypothetical protein AB7O26_20355 [Planctomycetaceae bacterium]
MHEPSYEPIVENGFLVFYGNHGGGALGGNSRFYSDEDDAIEAAKESLPNNVSDFSAMPAFIIPATRVTSEFVRSLRTERSDPVRRRAR